MNNNKRRRLYISLALILGVLASFVLACDPPDTPDAPNNDQVKYKVTFETDGGSPAPAEQTVVSGAKATKPADNLTKADSVFDDWYQVANVGDAVGATPYNFDAEVTGDIVLKAKWLVERTVTFELDSGTTTTDTAGLTVKVGDGTPLTIAKRPSDPTKADSVFGGWVAVANTSDTVDKDDATYNFEAKVTDNIILKAKWLPPPPKFTMSQGLVGMREFTVDVTPTSGSGTVVFIASKQTTAPEWSAISTNKALRRRKLTQGTLRSIFFSVTDEYREPKVPNDDNPIVLTAGGTRDEELAATAQAAPGIMTPFTDYYVYAYQNGIFLGTSPLIKTLDPPALRDLQTPAAADTSLANGPDSSNTPSLMPYLWRMDAWKKAGSNTELKPIQINYAELNLIPFRISGPAAKPTTACNAPTSKLKLVLSRAGSLGSSSYWSHSLGGTYFYSSIQTYGVRGRYGDEDVDVLLVFGPNIPAADRDKALTAKLAVCPSITTPTPVELTWPIESITE